MSAEGEEEEYDEDAAPGEEDEEEGEEDDEEEGEEEEEEDISGEVNAGRKCWFLFYIEIYKHGINLCLFLTFRKRRKRS